MASRRIGRGWVGTARSRWSTKGRFAVQGNSRDSSQWAVSKRRAPLAMVPLVLVILTVVVAAATSPINQLRSSSGIVAPRELHNIALTSGSDTWSVQHDGFATTGIACPSTTSCMAVGNVSEGGAYVTMTGIAWGTPAPITNGMGSPSTKSMSSISCPSTTICFGLGLSSTGTSVVEESTYSGSSWTWTQISITSSMNNFERSDLPEHNGLHRRWHDSD